MNLIQILFGDLISEWKEFRKIRTVEIERPVTVDQLKNQLGPVEHRVVRFDPEGKFSEN